MHPGITPIIVVVPFFLTLLTGTARAQTKPTRLAPEDNLTTVVGSNIDAQVQSIAKQAQGVVGVAGVILGTGRQFGVNSNEKFPMQSVYKLPIGMAVLNHVDHGKLALDTVINVTPVDYVGEKQHSPIRDAHPDGTEITIRELLKWMVSESDGSACDVLLGAIGGPGQVMTFLTDTDTSGISVINTEKEIGADFDVQYRNTATPAGIVQLLGKLHRGDGLSTGSRDLLLQMMIESPTGKKRIRGLLPANTVVAHKTGTSQTVDDMTAATNDVGIITLPNGHHLALAVFVSNSKADTATRERVIAEIARAAFDWAQE